MLAPPIFCNPVPLMKKRVPRVLSETSPCLHQESRLINAKWTGRPHLPVAGFLDGTPNFPARTSANKTVALPGAGANTKHRSSLAVHSAFSTARMKLIPSTIHHQPQAISFEGDIEVLIAGNSKNCGLNIIQAHWEDSPSDCAPQFFGSDRFFLHDGPGVRSPGSTARLLVLSRTGLAGEINSFKRKLSQRGPVPFVRRKT